MFEGLLQPLHLLIVLGIILLVFGPKNLPQLGKGMGEAIRNFKQGLHELSAGEDQPEKPAAQKAEQKEM